MSTSFPSPPPPPRKRTTLAKLAVIFAVILAITFGLCSAILIGNLTQKSDLVFQISITIEQICIAGLVIVGIVAIVKAFTRNR